MPSATDELRKRWDGPSETKAMKYLESRGYKHDKNWNWYAPIGLVPSEEDYSAVLFLFQEWDMGTIVVGVPFK